MNYREVIYLWPNDSEWKAIGLESEGDVRYVRQSARTVTLKQLRCSRCGYQWWPRTPIKPARCARCNSPYWNKPRGAKRGRPKK